MELNRYLDKRVQIILTNGFTYLGVVIFADENSLIILDKNSREVCLKENSINLIKEMQNGY